MSRRPPFHLEKMTETAGATFQFVEFPKNVNKSLFLLPLSPRHRLLGDFFCSTIVLILDIYTPSPNPAFRVFLVSVEPWIMIICVLKRILH